MARAVDQSDLHRAGVELAYELFRQLRHERREAQVQRDPSLLALRVLVETRGRADGRERPREAGLPGVDVAEDAHIDVQRLGRLRLLALRRHQAVSMAVWVAVVARRALGARKPEGLRVSRKSPQTRAIAT